MSIETSMREFPAQFLWEPEISRSSNIYHLADDAFVTICGMGGSALAGDFLKIWLKRPSITINRDFTLPEQNTPELVIIVSYSGNTEEALSCFIEAKKKNLPLIGIASGGTLETECANQNFPFIKLPQGFQPRETMGFIVKALASILAPDHVKELKNLAKKIEIKKIEIKGKKLAKKISGKIPLIYTSPRMATLGYNWKIRFNETGKTPAFTALIPELFHNEMTGFDMGKKSGKLKDKFIFIILEDMEDTAKHKTRFGAFEKFFKTKRFMLERVPIDNGDFCTRFFSSVSLADWTAYFLAKITGADPKEVPWVEEMKIRAASYTELSSSNKLYYD